MDTTKIEDTMVRQIEKSLSNNINENLFLTGRVYENNKPPVNSNTIYEIDNQSLTDTNNLEYAPVNYGYINDNPALSRAEYIRQAREACLRQLSATQVYSRPYEVNYPDMEAQNSDQLTHKKAKAFRLFQSGTELNNTTAEENTPQEIASYRSLIIRTVCAVVIFLSIFIIDKFELKIGGLTHHIIQQYVTGNDALQQLENILVAWLK
jgi:hypothetical protein